MTPAPSRADRDRSLQRAVRERLVRSTDVEALADAPPGHLERTLHDLLLDADPLLPHRDRRRLVTRLTHDVAGLGPLEPLLTDATVTEVMVNGGGTCFVERSGRLERVPLVLEDAQVRHVVERVIAPLGLRFDRAAPIVDARLADGSRLHAVMPPLAVDGVCLTIRRFTLADATLPDFDADGEAADLLCWAVAAGWNLLVSGGTSTGKSTLLQALATGIDAGERIVTIEETAELALALPHVVRLEARPPNAEGAGAVSVRDLVRAALRMRPDRIIVGETRGGEALDLLQALNTGHDGAISTVHASSPDGAIQRLLTLAQFAGSGVPHEALCGQVGGALDAVIQVERAADGGRRVVSMSELGPAGGIPRLRLLVDRSGGTLRQVDRPQRAARRSIGSRC
ncbi:MAG TPA: ATPase, T2SS/T4P/T4SS family [Acidimicrobiia bacterium]